MLFKERNKNFIAPIIGMLADRTVKARIIKPTSRKKKLLEEEYKNAQKYVSGESEKLYSATKQAMDKYAGKDDGEKKPLFLRNDTFQVEKSENTEEFDYWAKILYAMSGEELKFR